MPILEDLYYDSISPLKKNAEDSEEYKETEAMICRCINIISDGLDEDKACTLDELCELFREQKCICERESFASGFRMGAEIILALREKSEDTE